MNSAFKLSALLSVPHFWPCCRIGRCRRFWRHLGQRAGDISGNTFHGYGETRVTLQNHSAAKTHAVTLGYPNRSWNSGNTIDQVTRTSRSLPVHGGCGVVAAAPARKW